MENVQPTNQDILNAIQASNADVLDAMNQFASNTERRLSAIEKVLPTLVTKEYLHEYMDEKLGIVVGRQNRKTEALVEQLVSEKSLSRPAADRIIAMPPSLESR